MDTSNLSDDNLSASQLRKRYREMPDDEMSASQLRAKNAIPRNTFHHAPADNSMLVLGLALAALLTATALYFAL